MRAGFGGRRLGCALSRVPLGCPLRAPAVPLRTFSEFFLPRNLTFSTFALVERANLSRTRIYNSMAITRNVWLRGARQKAGGMVFYQAQGETRFRELAASVRNPRTEKQMAQRVRWANLVNFYRANRNWMQRAFENKPQNNTDYNRFMSLNGGTSDIYLTKQEANAGACVVNNYRVTDGTLNAIEVTASGSNWVTNIWTGELAALSASTTVGAFATALLSSNAGLRVGDQLSFIRMSQQVNSTTGFPFVIVRAYEVLLNPTSTELLSEYFPLDYFAIESSGGQNALRITNSNNAGGFVLVLSRTEGGIIRVSPQDVVVANNSALITRYSSAAQQQTAADSYGEGTEVFLSSASANEINPYGMDNSILAMTIAGYFYTPNASAPEWGNISEAEVFMLFSNPLGDDPDSVSMTFTKGNASNIVNVDSPECQQGKVYFEVPEVASGMSDYLLSKISVVVNGVTFTFDYDTDNELG